MNVAVMRDIQLEVEKSTLQKLFITLILFSLSIGIYGQLTVNVRNTSQACLPTNYSSLCGNQCLWPAFCSPINGQCECPDTTFLYTTQDFLYQTCICSGYPFVNYTNGTCRQPEECIVIRLWKFINANDYLEFVLDSSWLILRYEFVSTNARKFLTRVTNESTIYNTVIRIAY